MTDAERDRRFQARVTALTLAHGMGSGDRSKVKAAAEENLTFLLADEPTPKPAET